jgi:hypothetical protein
LLTERLRNGNSIRSSLASWSLQTPFQLPAFGRRKAGQEALHTDSLHDLPITQLFDYAVDADLFDDCFEAQRLNSRPYVEERFLSFCVSHGFVLLPSVGT